MELRHALAIEIEGSEFDEESLDDIKDIISVCCGLVIIDPETQTAKLVHDTTQEYFKKADSQHFPNGREDTAVSCLTYLLFDGYIRFDESGEGQTWHDTEGSDSKHSNLPVGARRVKYPFFGYIEQFWARRAEDYIASFKDRVVKPLVEFLTDELKNFKCWASRIES